MMNYRCSDQWTGWLLNLLSYPLEKECPCCTKEVLLYWCHVLTGTLKSSCIKVVHQWKIKFRDFNKFLYKWLLKVEQAGSCEDKMGSKALFPLGGGDWAQHAPSEKFEIDRQFQAFWASKRGWQSASQRGMWAISVNLNNILVSLNSCLVGINSTLVSLQLA